MASNNLTREEAHTRAQLLSAVSYRIRLDLSAAGDPQTETFTCEAEVDFRAATPGAETFIEFLAPGVDAMELNGEAVAPEAFDGNRIRLAGLQAANTLRVVGQAAYNHDGVGLHRFIDPADGRVYLHSDSEPYDIHRVYPCFDQPDLKATLNLAVNAPAGWHVAANSPPEETPPRDTGGWWTFAETPLLSTYITAIVAGEYHVVTDHHAGIDLALLCRQSMAAHLDPAEIFEITKQGLDFYPQAFGCPFPFAKYDQAFVPEFNAGAMENAGIVTFSERHIFRSRVTEANREARADTILHEMAHMWFGDLVTMRWWDDLWLNESFATFMANYAMVNATRFTGAWTTFSAGWKTWAYRQDQLPSTHPIVADMPDIDSVKVNFDGITYAKGASVLRQLVAWVGEEAFLAGIRVYFARHAWGNTTLDDFLAPLAETSGRDLHAWSKAWLETAGVNTLRPAVVFEEGPEGPALIASFSVQQEAPPDHPTLRPHRLGVGFYDADPAGHLTVTRRVELDVEDRETLLPELQGQPVPPLIVVNDGDLAYGKVRFDPASFATLSARLQDVADPLTRALCWAGCWDMTRDAELPTRSYLGLVLANAAGETEVATVETLLGQAASAIHLYGDPANRSPALAALATTAWDMLGQATPGSDHQLAWAKAAIGAARTTEHTGAARQLLDGTRSYQGLAVDTDLRWLIVRSLAASGQAGDDLIDAELARDATDTGARHAAAARAARPTAEAKAQAWQQILDPAVPFATMRAIMNGFQQADQAALLAPYAERFFEQVGPLFETRTAEVALAFAGSMYPAVQVDEATIAMTDRYLAEAGPPPPVRRLILEGRDGVLRALRARACDMAAAEASSTAT